VGLDDDVADQAADGAAGALGDVAAAMAVMIGTTFCS